jgi:CRISPR/Cas system-associated endonuclease/helicase Cas3
MEILDNIPVKLESEEVLKLLQLRNGNRNIETIVEELIERAQPIAKPKAGYAISRLGSRKHEELGI